MTSIEILKFFILIFLVGCQTCSSSKADGDIQTALGGGTGFLIKDPIWWKGRRVHEPPLAAKLNHGKGDDVSTGDVVTSINIVLRKVSDDIGIIRDQGWR